MTTRKIVTFRSADSKDRVDIELPGDVVLAELLPDLFKVLFQGAKARDLQKIVLWNEDEQKIDLAKSLDEQQISNSETIWLDFDGGLRAGKNAPQAKRKNKKILKPHGSEIEQDISSPPDMLEVFSQLAADRRGQIKLQNKEELQIEHPCLVYEGTEKGYLFVLGDSLASIGRPKGNYQPDIDLTEIDIEKISSRPHAEIERKDNQHIFRALKATNSTFVNGEELTANETHVLEDKEVIQFGFGGVKLIFRNPK